MSKATVILLLKEKDDPVEFRGVAKVTAAAIYSGVYPFEEDDGKGRYILIHHEYGIDRIYAETVEFVDYVEEAQQ
jgi:hypothetical protein